MNFTQGQTQQQQQSMMPTTNKKGSTSEEIDKGKKQIGDFAAKTADRPEVKAATTAAKKAANDVKDGVLNLFGLKDKKQPQLQAQAQMPYQGMGGKRRRKSRRKKRTKRRRKSRRKKRRTKRRRKSRRKRRR